MSTLISQFLVFFFFVYRGNWHIFSGNELGALLGWWMLHIYKTQNPESDLKDVYMLSSTVSSKILSSMAKKNGFQFEVRFFPLKNYTKTKL